MSVRADEFEYLIQSDDPEVLLRAEAVARQQMSCRRVHVDISYACPGGVPVWRDHVYPICEYFSRTEFSATSDGIVMRIRVREMQKRYWKDLIVAALRAIEGAGAKVRMIEKVQA